MSGVIAIVLAVIAVFLLVKVIGFFFKLLGVLLLVGAAAAVFVMVRNKIGGPK
jgi:hypothetical protein